MYVTTPDGKNHYIFDTTKDIPDILRQYVCDDLAEYIEEVLRDDETEMSILRDEVEEAQRESEMVWEEVRDLLVEIRDIADEVYKMQRVDRKKLDHKMKLISDMINRRL